MNPINTIQPIRWAKNHLQLLDQRLLPQQNIYLSLKDAPATAQAITDMVVRGAPAIGITAAYGVVLAARVAYAKAGDNWRQAIAADMQKLAASRPTAVNLFWALQRLSALFPDISGDPEPVLLAEALHIQQQDITDNQIMGDFGAAYLPENSEIITHCNAGALATGGYGTALGVVRSAWTAGKLQRVYADETRPWLQGARLTAWEMVQEKIPVTLIAEGAAAARMQQGNISWVIVGSDRIANNGDVANKIGTCGLAILARYYGVKFMVVAPTSTIDMQLNSGAEIPIEQRAGNELLQCGQQHIAADGAEAWNPVFDVTPADLVDVLVTERGAIEKPNQEKIAQLMK
ncbi:S-methyl-5-thioribose-1-phosphate isomerase [Candidatus Venteria ishoeyi]|uniref:Methylthioribose-1-phosphate isomerase n=1 Tax=Candidatus Venteria ishoeyi TaxID=1899563 RepID=A0A1H6F8V1_9GAMM|nr:S-methyl-5-thioribose-1-phosphate isomerase [Candidatus Venteria ishoeyi]SEH06557.1 Methylthioribose-1-phosphate isomerase [Candidatus Venteria ishoeyi]